MVPKLYAKLDQLRAERDELQRRLAVAERQQNGPATDRAQVIEAAIDALRSLRDTFAEADPEHVQELLASLVARIELHFQHKTVGFPRKAHLYDLRRDAYLGHTDRLDTDLGFEAHLYALLPYPVKAIRIEGPSAAKPGETSEFTLSVSADGGGTPALHVFRVDVFGPSGQALPWYAANVRAAAGRGQHRITWALSEQPGQYTVQVKDAASGVSCRESFEVGDR